MKWSSRRLALDRASRWLRLAGNQTTEAGVRPVEASGLWFFRHKDIEALIRKLSAQSAHDRFVSRHFSFHWFIEGWCSNSLCLQELSAGGRT